jgi:hypothetical protein
LLFLRPVKDQSGGWLEHDLIESQSHFIVNYYVRRDTSAVTAASVKAFPMALRFMIISFGFIKFSPFRKEIIPIACSPSACTGGSGGAEAAKFLYISFEAPGRRDYPSTHALQKSRIC